ncbi:hypothetical protein Tco_1239636 [Tanacetum coccineum]
MVSEANLKQVKILRGVDYDDLKRLFHVSKPIREVISCCDCKKWHYEYSTPKKIHAFRCSLKLEEFPQSNFEDVEAPNAPKQSRMFHPRWSRKNLATIHVSLFALPPLEHIQQGSTIVFSKGANEVSLSISQNSATTGFPGFPLKAPLVFKRTQLTGGATEEIRISFLTILCFVNLSLSIAPYIKLSTKSPIGYTNDGLNLLLRGSCLAV